MTDEAKLIENENGRCPGGGGWFVLNVADARCWKNERFGRYASFEGSEHRFPQCGINVHVLLPGQPNCLYHRENQQEDFLVLSGECVLVVEGQERPLKAWDFVHCPPETTHVFVGAGDGPCAILMMGARLAEEAITYPVDEVAGARGASAERETHVPSEAYASSPKWEPGRPAWPTER